jgi:hypothetical protein
MELAEAGNPRRAADVARVFRYSVRRLLQCLPEALDGSVPLIVSFLNSCMRMSP